MDYTLNFGAVWRNFEYLMSGLALSLGLAAVSILIGAAIGLALAFSLTSSAWRCPRQRGCTSRCCAICPSWCWCCSPISRCPSWVRIDKIKSFMLVLSLYSGAYLAEVFRAGLLSIPRA